MSSTNEIDVLEKRVSESRLYDMNFAPKMADSETISSIVSVVSTATTTGLIALTMGTPAISGQRVQFRLSGGSNGGKYLQIGKVLTSLGNEIQVEGYLTVKDPS